ncbi:hypothetical protein GCM10010922_03060 [Microbacterium sorbitolivorans]|uniref:hypothetical protein n=1 Tax=Microbacterium sorbitolivorans TaxID=1867410 RepID=UPI0013B05E88|nr:hypothetical protein [Microbacterium sorbitolivorans]GGF31398.1 hypothetical protein GCM10010922_03060 [Microbacterium sorbitolivorans]
MSTQHSSSRPRRTKRRRYRKAQGRDIWVFSDPNYQLQPSDIARIVVRAGLAQARTAQAKEADLIDTGAEEGTNA